MEESRIRLFCKSAYKNYSKFGLKFIAPMKNKKSGLWEIHVRRKNTNDEAVIELADEFNTNEVFRDTEDRLRQYLFEVE